MKWFGEDWGAPVCAWCEHIETPVGRCERCGEAIEAGDSGLALPFLEGIGWKWILYHRLCFLACVMPSRQIHLRSEGQYE